MPRRDGASMDTDDTIDRGARVELGFIRRLLDDHAHIAGDVLDVAPGTWAIHATIPVDGEVLVAEFTSYDAARHALASVPRADRHAVDRHGAR